jgi:hypothetical protein
MGSPNSLHYFFNRCLQRVFMLYNPLNEMQTFLTPSTEDKEFYYQPFFLSQQQKAEKQLNK